jgi:aminopeptidase 2
MARRAFPCWDEPLLKATYNITLVSHADMVNLSNMSASFEEPYNTDTSPEMGVVRKLFETLKISDAAASTGWKVTRFEKTPPVSAFFSPSKKAVVMMLVLSAPV